MEDLDMVKTVAAVLLVFSLCCGVVLRWCRWESWLIYLKYVKAAKIPANGKLGWQWRDEESQGTKCRIWRGEGGKRGMGQRA